MHDFDNGKVQQIFMPSQLPFLLKCVNILSLRLFSATKLMGSIREIPQVAKERGTFASPAAQGLTVYTQPCMIRMNSGDMEIFLDLLTQFTNINPSEIRAADRRLMPTDVFPYLYYPSIVTDRPGRKGMIGKATKPHPEPALGLCCFS